MIILLVFNNNLRQFPYNTRIRSVVFQILHFPPYPSWSVIFQVRHFSTLFGPSFAGPAFSGDPFKAILSGLLSAL